MCDGNVWIMRQLLSPPRFSHAIFAPAAALKSLYRAYVVLCPTLVNGCTSQVYVCTIYTRWRSLNYAKCVYLEREVLEIDDSDAKRCSEYTHTRNAYVESVKYVLYGVRCYFVHLKENASCVF